MLNKITQVNRLSFFIAIEEIGMKKLAKISHDNKLGTGNQKYEKVLMLEQNYVKL